METDTKSSVQSIDRALSIIEILSTNNGLSIKSLSEKTSLHKSTVYRLLQTLRMHNYVYQDSRTEQYFLGAKILELSANLMSNLDIRSVARPVLEKLCIETKQTVHLCILDGTDAVYIDKLENEHQAIRMYSQIGKHIPAYCSSAGKALVAWSEEEVRNRVISSINFFTRTKHTIINKEDYLRELAAVLRKGYAVDWCEHEENIWCVAAPVFDREQRVIAAISVSAGVWSLNAEQFVNMCEKTSWAAKTVSKYMGCRNSPATFSLDEADIRRIQLNNQAT